MIDDPYRSAPLVAINSDEAQSRAALTRELAPEEDLLWVGRPAQGFMLRSSDAVQIPFMVLWTAFACFWEWSVLHRGGPLIMPLFGLAFIGVGLYQLFGRFVADARMRSRTYYGLTKRRALLLVDGSTRRLVSVELDRPDEIQLEEKIDGSGSILFGRPVTTGFGNHRRTTRPTAFERIPRAREVFAILREAQAAERKK